ncbi:MAG TPA: hypothetical protein VIN04_05520 [Myxococcota bacterium]
MTPPKKSWIALVAFLLAVPVASNFPLSVALLLLLLALVGYAIFQATLRCLRCGTFLLRRRVAGITLYVPIAPSVCEHSSAASRRG